MTEYYLCLKLCLNSSKEEELNTTPIYLLSFQLGFQNSNFIFIYNVYHLSNVNLISLRKKSSDL